jgi:hypothetical protein
MKIQKVKTLGTCHRKNRTNIFRREAKTTILSVTDSPQGKYLVLKDYPSKLELVNYNYQS